MELWTVQDARVMDAVDSVGVYRVAVEHIYPNELAHFLGQPDRHTLAAYDWMCEKMREKVGAPPEGVSYPIWAWRKQQERSFSDKHPGKPDMRSWVTGEPQQVVRLRLEVPDEDCLVTDFDSWHIPLNFAYFAMDEEDERRWDAHLGGLGLEYLDPADLDDHRPETEEARREIYSSWDRMFSPELLDAEYWGLEDPERQTLQATFWELKACYIRSVEHFTTRDNAITRAKFNEQARRNRERLLSQQQQDKPA